MMDMDLKKIAKIKVNSRLRPAKDMHVAYSDLLSCSDPNNFEELKNKLILSIDSAEVEYKILQDELKSVASLIAKWENESEQCQQSLNNLQEENITLIHEKDDIEDERKKTDELIKMQSTIETEHVEKKMKDIQKMHDENLEKEGKIVTETETNEKRHEALAQIVDGYEKFLMIEKKTVVQPETTEETIKDELPQ